MEKTKNSENSDRHNTDVMARTKATVRKILQALVQRNGNKNILNKRVRSITYKIKNVLPQSRVEEVKQNSRVVRRMNVRRKSYDLH